MLIGDVLVAQGLVTQEDVEAALERQRSSGGILGEHLIALGKLDPEDLERVMQSSPPTPRSIEETGLDVAGAAQPRDQDDLRRREHALGDRRHAEAAAARRPARAGAGERAQAARRARLDRHARHIGAALRADREGPPVGDRRAGAEPVYRPGAGVAQRAISSASSASASPTSASTAPRSTQAFDNLIVSEEFIHQIGPAINSGRSILLYGAARQRQDLGGGAHRLDLQGHDLHPLLLRGRRPDHQGVRPGIHKRIERAPDSAGARHAAPRGFRPALGALPAALHRHRRRADARNARPQLQRAGQILRGAAAHQGARRHLHDRRFRPPAGQARRRC